MSIVMKEKFPTPKTVVLSDLCVGDMFMTNSSDNIFLICSFNNTRIYISLDSAKPTPFYDDIEVYPIDFEINYSKHY